MEFRALPPSSAFLPPRTGVPLDQAYDEKGQEELHAASSPTAQLPEEKWPERLTADDRRLIQECIRSRKFLDDVLRRECSWAVPSSWQPEDPLWKLALLKGAHFGTLNAAAGFHCASSLIRMTIDRKTLSQLARHYGQRYLDYALLRSPHLKVPIPTSCEIEAWSEKPCVDIERLAALCWSAALAGAEPAQRQRVEFKGIALQNSASKSDSPQAIQLLETLASEFGLPGFAPLR